MRLRGLSKHRALTHDDRQAARRPATRLVRCLVEDWAAPEVICQHRRSDLWRVFGVTA